MCCKLKVIFETHCHMQCKNPTLYYLSIYSFPPHTHIPVPIPKLDLKIPEDRAYPSFNFPIGPNIVARNIWDDPYYLMNG